MTLAPQAQCRAFSGRGKAWRKKTARGELRKHVLREGLIREGTNPADYRELRNANSQKPYQLWGRRSFITSGTWGTVNGGRPTTGGWQLVTVYTGRGEGKTKEGEGQSLKKEQAQIGSILVNES